MVCVIKIVPSYTVNTVVDVGVTVMKILFYLLIQRFILGWIIRRNAFRYWLCYVALEHGHDRGLTCKLMKIKDERLRNGTMFHLSLWSAF